MNVRSRFFPLRRGLAVACLLGLTLARAHAHAFLDRADPAVGGSARRPPAEVRLWFTMDLDAAHCRVQVLDAAGKPVDRQDLHLDPKDSRCLRLSLPAAGATLAAGAYQVVWRVRPAGEGEEHVTHGEFTFRVEERR